MFSKLVVGEPTGVFPNQLLIIIHLKLVEYKKERRVFLSFSFILTIWDDF